MRDPSKELVKAVQQSSLPTILLRVDSEEILAASEEAGRLIGRTVDELVGHSAEEFTEDPPSGALPLVASGRLSGFQARRYFRGADGVTQPLQTANAARHPMARAVGRKGRLARGLSAAARLTCRSSRRATSASP